MGSQSFFLLSSYRVHSRTNWALGMGPSHSIAQVSAWGQPQSQHFPFPAPTGLTAPPQAPLITLHTGLMWTSARLAQSPEVHLDRVGTPADSIRVLARLACSDHTARLQGQCQLQKYLPSRINQSLSSDPVSLSNHGPHLLGSPKGQHQTWSLAAKCPSNSPRWVQEDFTQRRCGPQGQGVTRRE